jgi:hypothetical protein
MKRMLWFLAFSMICHLACQGQAFQSFSDFWKASPNEVERRLSAKPLNLALPMDRKVRDIMDELDRLNQMTTNVYWADGYGASAHPLYGIGLDRKQLQALTGDQSFDDVVLLILGHEQAHMAQFKYYSSGLDDPQRRRAIECQADILGGFSFVGTLLQRAHPASSMDFKKMSDHIITVSMKVGSPAWDDQTQHPRPEQRSRAVSLGMLSMLQFTDWHTYGISHDPSLLEVLRKAESENADIYRPSQSVLDWSNDKAKEIARVPSEKTSTRSDRLPSYSSTRRTGAEISAYRQQSVSVFTGRFEPIPILAALAPPFLLSRECWTLQGHRQHLRKFQTPQMNVISNCSYTNSKSCPVT